MAPTWPAREPSLYRTAARCRRDRWRTIRRRPSDMKKYLAIWLIAGIVSLPALCQVQAEGGGQALAALVHLQSKSIAATPRTADRKPNLSGIWGPDVHFMYDISSALKLGDTLPIRPEAAKITKDRMSKDDPDA